jgi:hypothetical protein
LTISPSRLPTQDILNTLTPKQKADLFQQRVQQLASQQQTIPWNPDAVQWIQDHFWIPENKGPMNLYPYQIAALREALRRDSAGKFVYSTVIWSDIKKSGKCVRRNTEIVLGNSTRVLAQDVRVGDRVLAYNEDTSAFVPKRVTAVQEQPAEPVYKIRTKRGREIVVSAEHPFLVLGHRPPSLHRVDKGWQDYPKWIPARDLTPEHRVAVALGFLPDLPATGAETRNAYMLGAFAGDGGGWGFTTGDPEIVAPFQEVFDVICFRKYQYRLRGAGSWLREHGFLVKPEKGPQKACNAYTKKTPLAALSGGRLIAAHYLAGLFDTDGTVSDPAKARRPVVSWTLVNKALLLDAQHLLAGLGINASLRPGTASCNGKKFDVWHLAINGRDQVARFSELVPSRLPRKKARLLGWSLKEKEFDKHRSEYSLHDGDVIESIEILAPEVTIAIEVDGLHTHITAGLITHNSTLAAGVALWRAWGAPWGSVYLVANDLKQADSRVGYYMRRGIELNPVMRNIVKQRNYRLVLPNSAFIESIPIDPSGEAGSNADGVVFSELWGAHQQAQQRMWTEATLPPNKFGYSQRWVETYAGFTGESPLLEQLYEVGVKQGRQLKLEGAPDDLEVYANDTARLFVLWNTVPRLPWQSPEYYCLPLPENKRRFQVMTKLGPKPAADITLEDELAVRDLAGNVSFSVPKALHTFPDYSGTLFHYKNSKAEFRVTAGHRLLAKTKKHERNQYGDYSLAPVDDLSKHAMGSMPRTGGTDAKGIEFFDIEGEIYDGTDFIEFVAWYVSEGSTLKSKGRGLQYFSAIQIAQDITVNPSKHKRIGELLVRLGLGEQIKSKKTGWFIYNSRLARWFGQLGKAHEKFIPERILNEASQEQLERFVEAYVLGDGTKSGRAAIMLYTNSDYLKDDLSLLAWKAGYSVTYAGAWASAPNRKPIHHLRLAKTDLGWSRGTWTKETVEHLPVWCPETETGTFYAIVDGKGFWTGNSQESAVLAPSEFQRVHRNQWVSSSQTFVPIEWWDACQESETRPIKPLASHRSLVFGVDAGVSSDCFAIVGVERIRGSAKDHTEDRIVVRYAKAWYPPKGGKIDFAEPEAEIMRLYKKYRVLEWAYDQYQLHDMATRLKKRRVGWWNPFNQSATRFVADKNLYDLIREGRILHSGDPMLREHIMNANAEIKGEKMRIVKRAEYMKIDLTVALSMAAYEALRLNL